MSKINRSIVRNQAYQKSAFSIRERHNERLNETYYNSDIQSDRQHLNVYFKQSEDSYTETFEKMLADGTISTRGLKADAKVFDEFVFDVNTEYFDRNGGYEYAKSFFEEAYRHAVKEIGGEEYVLSAVMHADERNKALSEQFGRDVYHYHLHVVYVPVVDKEILWTKRCKDPELIGMVKEVIKQVSHSKKWTRFKTERGWINSYSLLQDRFHDHMKNAGYIGFERGERGSTAEHLSTEEYKVQKEKERADEYTAIVEIKQVTADKLDTVIAEKTEKSTILDNKLYVKKQHYAKYLEIDEMAKKTIFGKIELSQSNWKEVSNLAKEGISTRNTISFLNEQLNNAKKEIVKLKSRLDEVLSETKVFRDAIKAFPEKVKDFFANLVQKKDEQQLLRQKPIRNKKYDFER